MDQSCIEARVRIEEAGTGKVAANGEHPRDYDKAAQATGESEKEGGRFRVNVKIRHRHKQGWDDSVTFAVGELTHGDIPSVAPSLLMLVGFEDGDHWRIVDRSDVRLTLTKALQVPDPGPGSGTVMTGDVRRP